MSNWALDMLNPRMQDQARRKLAKMGNKRTVNLLDGERANPGQSAIESKYKNKKVQTEEASFASEKEYKRYQELKLLLAGGQIRNLELQKRFILAEGCEIYGKKLPPIRYFCDFYYEEKTHDGWRVVVEDTKGIRTRVYLMKRHMMKTVHGIQILET